MRILAMAAVLFIFGLPSVALQEPAPTPRKGAAKVQSKSSQGQQNTKTHQCGTNESPCIVKVIPPDTDPKKADDEAKKENEHAANEGLTAWATVTLAVITFALAIFTGLLWYITRKLVIDTQKAGTEATQIASNAATAASRNAEAAIKSADALIASERAWVMVDLEWAGVGKVDVSDPQKTKVNLQCRCTNQGKTPAWIDEIYCCLIYKKTIPPVPDMTLPTPWHGRPEPLAAGQQFTPYTFALDCDGQGNEGDTLLVYGFVNYRSMFNDEKRTNKQTNFGYVITLDETLNRIAGYTEYNRNT